MDDPSRILRGIRFANRFNFKWEQDTKRKAIESVRKGLLGELNAGRLSKEFNRILDEPNPRRCLKDVADLISSGKL